MLSHETCTDQQTEDGIVLSRMGADRLESLQGALADHTGEEAETIVARLIASHNKRPQARPLDEIGYSTVADAIAELTSKRSARKLAEGKVGLNGAIEAHRQRALQAAALASRSNVQEAGVQDAEIIYSHDETGIDIVHLSEPEHAVYDGVTLINCLADLSVAGRYLDREGRSLYSLRERATTTPLATIEVALADIAIIQARGQGDAPLTIGSPEHLALTDSMPAIANHAYAPNPSPGQLTITDSLVRA